MIKFFLYCYDICQTLLQIIKAFLAADLRVADLETIVLYASIQEVICLYDKHGNLFKTRVNLAIHRAEGRWALRCIKSFNYVVAAVARVYEHPHLLRHKLEVLALSAIFMQVRIDEFTFETSDSARTFQILSSRL